MKNKERAPEGAKLPGNQERSLLNIDNASIVNKLFDGFPDSIKDCFGNYDNHEFTECVDCRDALTCCRTTISRDD
jgi:hypothetical protein